MTYREIFDHLGRPHGHNTRPVNWQTPCKWLATLAVLLAWAALVGWMDSRL